MNNNFCYIHIPFCTSKCKYCRFASFGNLDSKKVDLYVDFLLKEIKTNKIDFKNLKSIYFGGGTPSILSIKQLGNIISTLRNKYKFNDDIEITLEATPITITKENLLGWKNLGINRLSIGIQTLNNDSLVEIGRGNKGEVIMCLDEILKSPHPNHENSPHPIPLPRGEGIASKSRKCSLPLPLGEGIQGGGLAVSVDFIIGLPFVKKGEVKKDIEFVLNKYDFIKHISVYMLEENYYPGNWKEISISEDEYLGEYTEISNFLKSRGFNRYEISNYALPGYECKHNKAYWNHSNILAFGLGSHGFVNNTRYANSENFIDYYSGKQKIEDKQTFNDLFIEKVMFQLRNDGLTKDIYKKLNLNKIEYLIQEKYLEKKSDKIILSDKGVLVLDYILGEII